MELDSREITAELLRLVDIFERGTTAFTSPFLMLRSLPLHVKSTAAIEHIYHARLAKPGPEF